MNYLENNWLRLIAIVLLGCSIVGTWPYAFFQLLRWVVSISAGVTAYQAFNVHKEKWGWAFIAVLVLFNPIASFYMERSTWVVFDILTLVLYLQSLRGLDTKIHKK